MRLDLSGDSVDDCREAVTCDEAGTRERPAYCTSPVPGCVVWDWTSATFYQKWESRCDSDRRPAGLGKAGYAW